MKATSVVILGGMLALSCSAVYAQGGAQASSSASGSRRATRSARVGSAAAAERI